MPDEFYASGVESALEDLVLEEVAYIPTQKSASIAMGAQMLGRGAMAAGKGLMSAVKAPFQAYGKHVSEPLGRLGQRAETAVGQQAAQRLSPQAAANVQSGIEGMAAKGLRDGAGGAVIGGTLMGGIGAAGAEEGQRLQAFGKGFGQGAAVGALSGGVGGAVGKGVGNLGKMSLTRAARGAQAARGGNMPGVPEATAQAQMGMGFKENVKQVFRPGQGMGRGSAAIAAATPATAFATDMVAGDVAIGALTPKTASTDLDREFHNSGMPIVGAAMGSGAGTIGTIALRRALRNRGLLGNDAFTSDILPAIGATAGSLGGYTTAQKLYPSKREDQLKKLEDIDIDKLMRYYKAKPDQAATSS